MLEPSNDKSFGLNDLTEKGIKLSTKALEVFKEEAQDQNISIQVKYLNDELFTLNFTLDDVNTPDRIVTQTVGATIEALLNQIPLLQLVQNKN